MGGCPYWYFVEYKGNVEGTLAYLRKREFDAGRYEPAMATFDVPGKLRLAFPVDLAAPSPGAQHDSPRAALEASMEQGTRSILDITMVSNEGVDAQQGDSGGRAFGLGGRRFQTSHALTPEFLRAAFGSAEPTRATVEEAVFGNTKNAAAEGLWNTPRGTAVHIVTYKNSEPAEVLFLGYSFD